jgi:predicted DNA-binding transcriptional regulator YafY
VYTERGRNGGIRLLDGFRSGGVRLTPAEAAGLAVGQPRLAADLGLGNALDVALEKVLGTGGPASRDGFERGRARILVDPQPWMRSAEPAPELPQIHEGLSRGRRLRLEYVDSDGGERASWVDPLGLVAKAGSWYLVAVPRGRSSPRLYRVSRVRACEVSAEAAVVPAAFDLAAAWERLRSGVEERRRGIDVDVAVDAEALPMVRRLLAAQVRRDADDSAGDGGNLLHLTFAGLNHAVGSLLGLGTRVEVLEPPALRAAMRDAALEVSALYA